MGMPNKKSNDMKKKFWSLIPFAIWWTIWKERNARMAAREEEIGSR